MPKIPLKTVLLGIVFIALAVGIFFIIKLPTSTDTPNGSDSTFGGMIPDNQFPETKLSNSEIFEKYGQRFNNDPVGEMLFTLGWDLVPFDYFAPWDYEVTPFWSTVVGVSANTSELTIKFVSPESVPFKNQEKTVSVAGCNMENSFFTAEASGQDPRVSRGDNVNIIKEIMVGDDFIGVCLNEECTQVGRMCKIFRY